MQRFMFNPSLGSPLGFIHPIQFNGILRFLNEPFPDYIDFIILFGGSLDLACGVDSDLDLYVISEQNPEVVYATIYDRCKNLGRPFDILVSSYEDFVAEAAELGTVEHRIMQEGLCLYDKAKDNTARAS